MYVREKEERGGKNNQKNKAGMRKAKERSK
jgi:hypothetical protein